MEALSYLERRQVMIESGLIELNGDGDLDSIMAWGSYVAEAVVAFFIAAHRAAHCGN